ncbi:MAG TPA: helix-turn-helix transcriptional regulator [Caulobacteraceae bacterium]|jgi:DNA-binding CsgD family transcriptional regulator/PAS domain-containing protein|nr:helix-turn-helix transcriptional regulator [Caulobacteraceae bacterium]
MNETQYAGFLDRLYGSVVERDDWTDIIARFADMVGGAQAWLPSLDLLSGGGDGVIARIDPKAQDAYFQYYFQTNPFVRLGPAELAAPWPLAITTDEDRFLREDFVRTEYYNDFLRPQEIHSTLVVRLGRHGVMQSTLSLGRPVDRGQFSRSDIELANRLHPDLVRAFNLSRRFADLKDFSAGLAETLNRSRHAVLLLDAAGRIRHANAAAQALLGEPDGLCAAAGRLTAASTADARRLEGLIARAASPDASSREAGSMGLRTPSRRLPLSLIVAPLRSERSLGPGAASVLVCVADLEASLSPPERQLRDLFGLTPAEIRLALALLEGASLRETAQSLGTRLTTVRNQLASIFVKTDVNRQAELIQLMMRLLMA